MSIFAEEGDDLIRRADAMEKMEAIEESRITATGRVYFYDRKIIESSESTGVGGSGAAGAMDSVPDRIFWTTSLTICGRKHSGGARAQRPHRGGRRFRFSISFQNLA